MSWAELDDVRDHHPQGTCASGADLAGAQDLGVARSFQQLEIPEPAARRIQHDLHLGLCDCGREHVAAHPSGVPDTAVSIGPNLRALAVYLLAFQHVPVEVSVKGEDAAVVASVAAASVGDVGVSGAAEGAGDEVADACHRVGLVPGAHLLLVFAECDVADIMLTVFGPGEVRELGVWAGQGGGRPGAARAGSS